MNKPKILLISYYFPPYKKVGGRRWAKHCKYLIRLGIETHVLSCQFPDSTSSWDKDVLEYEKFVTRIKVPELKTPYFKKTLPTTTAQKIFWKLSLWSHKVKKVFSNTAPKISENTAPYFFKAASLIIEKESVNTVILSIGPYKYSEVMVPLKLKFPIVKFILDDRDYWNEEFEKLSIKEQIKEKEFQKKVISQVDLIISPYMEMKKRYEASFNKDVYWLPHCVDMEEIPQYKAIEKKSIATMIYGGAFYKEIDSSIDLIKKCVDLLAHHTKVEVEFYVSVKGYEKELEHPFIKRYGFIDSQEYFLKVQESNYVILILPPNRVNAMSSKFFELVAMRKPILYFGGEGDVADYLISNRLGYHITKENINSISIEIFNNIENNLVPDIHFDISMNTFENQTKLLAAKIESL